MAPSALTVIRTGFLDFDEVNLSVLVPDSREPGQDYWPLEPPTITRDQINIRTVTDLYDSLANGNHAGLAAKLTRIFSADVHKKSASVAELMARTSTLYYLKQPKLHFTALCQDNKTKDWMKQTMKHFPIFMVVGFLTVTGAHVERADGRDIGGHVKAEVSAADIVSHGITAAIPNMPASASVSVDAQVSVNKRYEFTAPGERIVGVQYKKLKFELFKRGDIKLEESQTWEMFLGDHRSDNRQDRDDVLGVDLEESLSLEDLELEEDGDEELNPVVDAEEFVFLEE